MRVSPSGGRVAKRVSSKFVSTDDVRTVTQLHLWNTPWALLPLEILRRSGMGKEKEEQKQ